MPDDPLEFDFTAAHKYFAARCFNQAWELIDKPDRTANDDQRMIDLAHASMFHWTQHPERTDKNLSIAYWLLSRVYSLVSNGDTARRYAELCLDITPKGDHFCLGYAYEALARAARVAESEQVSEYLAKGKEYMERVVDEEDRRVLAADLQGLK